MLLSTHGTGAAKLLNHFPLIGTLVACPEEEPVGVVPRVLIERDLLPAVVVANDVAAAPAVVSTKEEREGYVADGTVLCRFVWLPVRGRRRASDDREVVELETVASCPAQTPP